MGYLIKYHRLDANKNKYFFIYIATFLAKNSFFHQKGPQQFRFAHFREIKKAIRNNQNSPLIHRKTRTAGGAGPRRAGYAGSANRGYCKDRGIQTSFVKRGRPSLEKKENDIIRNELARVRATRMEGSFGTQKEHYGLKRIKARTKLTEILYIFFGIHTANAVQLVRREVNEIAQAA